MGSLRQRNGQLFFDFRFQGVRCREQTTLSDTQGNRKKLVPILERIEAAIKLGTFHFITQDTKARPQKGPFVKRGCLPVLA